ncbi:MAG: cytochrome c oxidase subunit [Gaiellales bacterium]|nr:cytochrome c oxidase subunit [Gaiellales bacterium]
MRAHAATPGHGGPPAGYGHVGHLDRVMIGLIVALASEIMLFGAFFTAFFYVRYTNYPVYPPEPFEMPVDSTGINTAILVSSSFTMHWALVSIKRNNRRGLALGLLFTLIMGLTFLGLQIREYNLLHIEGFTPEHGAFASVFFALTGLHGIHVLIGAILLAMALVRTLRGHFSPEKHMGVELPGIYWHFVDVVWVVLYTLVYLLSSGARAPL